MPDTPPHLADALADRYRLDRELGAGGMATVYLAHDLRHDRKVALKVLRPELAAVIGAERFLAEIRTTANLQHPHILALFDSGRTGGAADLVYYVMPYVEGESLRDRLLREKQLPVADALRIAREVADALEYAHRHDVIHRDIKPENILLHGGHALVADFGIALAASRSDGGSRMTETGMSLGTPHYMSPEQAMGEREITARSDVYALGCVLYEMLCGEPPFTGPTAQAIVARVMTEEPRSLTLQRKSIPPHVESAVATALEKLPADRYPSAAAFAAALDDATAATAPRRGRAPAARVRGLVPVVAATAVAVALGTFAVTRTLLAPGGSARGRGVRASIVMPAGYELGSTKFAPISISEDGTRIAFVGQKDGRDRIFVRALHEVEAKPLEGTEGGNGQFFSPDGQWIGFFSGGKLRKITVAGTGLQTLTDARFHRGGHWADDGYIYFAPYNMSGIWRVPEAGGTAEQVTTLDTAAGEISHRWPHRVAGTNTLLFAVWTGPGLDEHHIAATAIGTSAHRVLVRGGDFPKYATRPGRLVYAYRGQLLTVPWRPTADDFGKAVPEAAAEQLRVDVGNEGSGNYAVSGDGTLIYAGADGTAGTQRLVWIGPGTARTTVPQPERIYENVAVSPDGRRAVVQIRDATTRLWIYDFERSTLTPLPTGAGSSQAAVWSADGRRIYYRGTRQGTRNLYGIAADGSGEEERLTTLAGTVQTPTSVSADGRLLLFDQNGADEPEGTGIWVVLLDGDRQTRRLLPPTQAGRDGQLSPDGKWVAFIATVSSRQEVFVAPFSAKGERRLVSTDGGTEPLWSPDGRRLFYRTGSSIMGVDVTPGAEFSASAPRRVQDVRFLESINGNTSYGVAPDGSRFLVSLPVAESPAITQLELVLDWFGELERRGAGRNP